MNFKSYQDKIIDIEILPINKEPLTLDKIQVKIIFLHFQMKNEELRNITFFYKINSSLLLRRIYHKEHKGMHKEAQELKVSTIDNTTSR